MNRYTAQHPNRLPASCRRRSAPPSPFPSLLALPAAITKAAEEGHDINEVEGAGNTPLHFACYEGWLEG